MAASSMDKVLEDNTAWYRLYPAIKPGRSSREFLTQYITDAFGRLAKFLTRYIWQNEPFSLRVVEDAIHQGPHIEGYTCFGDNVEDEWFIVFLLSELTKADPELVVKIEDSDGEFLLIEAADSLPRWADPDTSENRVYIFQSEVHLIPLKKGPIPCDTPLIPDAVRAIRSYKNETKCSESIQATINGRIKGYPENILKLQHRTKCFIPAAVASLLDADPTLVSPAISAFYHRDPIDMTACRAMKFFPPENRVMKTVTLTRCMYGQLMGQKYSPDRKIGWDMPPLNSPHFKSYDLGMKIACGFEILAATTKPTTTGSKNNHNSAMGPIEADIDDEDYRFQRYVKSLENNGYFQGQIQGSVRHSKLLAEAKTFYVKYVASTFVGSGGGGVDKRATTRSEVGNKIMKLLETTEIDYEKLNKESKHAIDDDDKWMHVTSGDFDELLKQRFFGNGSVASAAKSASNSQKVPDALKNFVMFESGLKGVEAPPAVPPRRKHKVKSNEEVVKPPSNVQSPESFLSPVSALSPNSDTDETNSRISFEPENFADAIRSVLSMNVPHTDSEASSSSGMSDYSDESDTQSLLSEEDELVLVDKRKSAKNNKDGKAESLVDEMKNYMNQMDRELADTKVGESFEKTKKPPLATYDEEEDADVEDNEDSYKPVDVDMNALKNILESINSQSGLPGPSSNILQSMGLFMSKNSDSHQ